MNLEHLKLTAQEAETLKSVKEYLDAKVAALKSGGDLFPNKVHPELLERDFDGFFKRRSEFEKRWMKYKNQIFGILNETDWRPCIDAWINRMCPTANQDEHYLMDMRALSSSAHNLLALQYLSNNTNQRMINAILTEQGYEEGIGTIRELKAEENKPETIQAFQKYIDGYALLLPYKSQLLEYLRVPDFGNKLHEWIAAEKLPLNKAYSVLTELSTAIYYLKNFEYSDEIQDELDEVIEVLWNNKSEQRG